MESAKDVRCFCGERVHDIFVGDFNHLAEVPYKVTHSAITAVRDYMVDDMNAQGEASIGYQWKRKDGKTVKLVCMVEDA